MPGEWGSWDSLPRFIGVDIAGLYVHRLSSLSFLLLLFESLTKKTHMHMSWQTPPMNWCKINLQLIEKNIKKNLLLIDNLRNPEFSFSKKNFGKILLLQ